MGNQIPHKRLTRRRDNRSKSICDGCKKDLRVRNLILFKGEFLCRNCRNKKESFRIQSSASQIGRGYISLEEALERTYEIKRYSSYCGLGLPICLTGKKIKIVLVDEEEKNI